MPRQAVAWVWVAAIVAVKLALHIGTSLHEGYFRDEFYYVACANHPALGYVDHPPLSIALLWFLRLGFGDSRMAMRIVAALCGGGSILFGAVLTALLGGSRRAQILAMTCLLICPILLGVNSFYSMNSIEILLWAAAACVAAMVLRQSSIPGWLTLGLLIGLGLLNKLSMSWFAGGLFAGLLFTRQRRLLATSGPWLATLLAALVFAPHILWQVANNAPTLEFMRNAAAFKMQPVPPLAFILNQLLVVGPMTAPVWLMGLIFYFASPSAAAFRPLGWIYVAVLLLLIASGSSRANYLAPAYVVLFAGGAVAIEQQSARRHHPAFTTGMSLAILLLGLITLPLALQVLPPTAFVTYSSALGMAPRGEERDAQGVLPQHFSDRYGWPELVAGIAEVFHSLPAAEQQEAAIFTGNYGQAGAIEVLGREYGLPQPLSGHNNYWLWGPGTNSGRVVIVVGIPGEALLERFDSVEQVGVTSCEWCRPIENNRPIFVCRGPKQSLLQMWPHLKVFR